MNISVTYYRRTGNFYSVSVSNQEIGHIEILVDSKTKEDMGYRTPSGKIFIGLEDAIEQLMIDNAKPALDNMYVIFRTLEDFPFVSKSISREVVNYIQDHRQPDIKHKKVHVMFGRPNEPDLVINYTEKTLLVVDNCYDNVFLVPSGMSIELMKFTRVK